MMRITALVLVMILVPVAVAAETVTTDRGGRRVVLENRIMTMQSLGGSDPIWNGLLIGAGVGAGTGVLMASATCGEFGCGRSGGQITQVLQGPARLRTRLR